MSLTTIPTTMIGSGSATGLAINSPMVVNTQTITQNTTLYTGTSAMSSGPISIASGVTVTLQSGTRWAIL
jgi:hypothetical protein